MNYKNELYVRDKVDEIFIYMQDKLYSEVIKYIWDCKKPKVLDVGCGVGGLLHHVHNVSYYGIDVSKPNIEKIKQNRTKLTLNLSSKDINVKRGDIRERLPYQTGMFDYIICSEVLEHFTIYDIHKILKEIKRVCKRDGKIIITAPNIKYLWAYLPWSIWPFKKRMEFGDWKLNVMNEEYKQYHSRFKPKWFKKLIERYFEVEDMKTTFWYNNRVIHGILPKLQMWLHKKSWDHNTELGNNIILRCRKR